MDGDDDAQDERCKLNVALLVVCSVRISLRAVQSCLCSVAGLPRPGRSPSWRRLEWSGSRTTWKCASRGCSRTAELTLLAQLSFLLERVGDIDCSILCAERSFLHCCSTAQHILCCRPICYGCASGRSAVAARANSDATAFWGGAGSEADGLPRTGVEPMQLFLFLIERFE